MSYPISDGLRKAGMVFREEFTNIPTITDNGGVLVGSPAVDRGVTLNGTTQYISYPNKSLGYFPGTGFVVARFVPQFAANDGAARGIVACGAAGNPGALYLMKDGANQLIAWLGVGYVLSNLADYTAQWLVGQENVVAASMEGASSNIWLNGTLLVTSKIAMTSGRVGVFSLGGLSGLYLFNGTIKSVRIGTKPITALDVPVLSVAS